MPTVTLRSAAGERVLEEDEVSALLWIYDFAAHTPSGTGGSAASRLAVAGGVFREEACGELLAFCEAIRNPIGATPLEVWKKKYGSNGCLGSSAGHALVVRHKVPYLNRNTDPPAVFVGKARASGGERPGTLLDVPPVRSAIEALEAAARTGQIDAGHSDPTEFF